MNAVELNEVTKRFGTFTAVDHLTLNVPTGSVYGFIGPNGSGKTTTLRMIMRIIYPNSGTIRVLGQDVIGTGAATDRVGYLPEERGLYRKMKVKEIIRFHSELKGRTRPGKDIDRWLEKVGLEEQMVAATSENEEMAGRISSLEGTIRTLRSRVAARERTITEKDERIASLESEVAGLDGQVSDLRSQVSSLQAERDNLQTQLDETISSKNGTITLLIVLLVIAILAAGGAVFWGMRKGA